jgi:hypothetical protein
MENYFNQSVWGVNSNGFKQFERGKSGVFGVDLPECSPLTANFSRLAHRLRRSRGLTLLGWEGSYGEGGCSALSKATNWRAEGAIRPMVVARKARGGNRTPRGAQTQSIQVSFLQTCRQQLQPASPLIQNLLCSSQPKVLGLPAPTR